MDSLSRKTNIAIKFYESTQRLIRFADSKVYTLSVINGVATSFIITNFHEMYTSSVISRMVLILFFVTFAVFVFFTLHTILPRLGKKEEFIGSQIIYFGHVSRRKSVMDFINDFKNTTSEEFLDEILQQIYESSKIADAKFRYYRKSLLTLQFQILLFLILFALKSIS